MYDSYIIWLIKIHVIILIMWNDVLSKYLAWLFSNITPTLVGANLILYYSKLIHCFGRYSVLFSTDSMKQYTQYISKNFNFKHQAADQISFSQRKYNVYFVIISKNEKHNIFSFIIYMLQNTTEDTGISYFRGWLWLYECCWHEYPSVLSCPLCFPETTGYCLWP